MAQRLTQVQRDLGSMVRTLVSPGSGRSFGHSKTRESAPVPGYVFSQKPLLSFTAPVVLADVTAAIRLPVWRFVFVFFLGLHAHIDVTKATITIDLNTVLFSLNCTIDPGDEGAAIDFLRCALIGSRAIPLTELFSELSKILSKHQFSDLFADILVP